MSKVIRTKAPNYTNKNLVKSAPIKIPASSLRIYDFLPIKTENTLTDTPYSHPNKELIGVFWFDLF